MALNTFEDSIRAIANDFIVQIETYFKEDKADALFYYGNIDGVYEEFFRAAIEQLVEAHKTEKRETLVIILHTNGGSIETTEKYVNMIRTYYKKVFFIVPTFAMSAGTIFCMSGNKIFMDYSSCLGPIDAQVYSSKEGKYVPASGYLYEVEEIINKSVNGTLSNVEVVMLQNQDLAFLNYCKQISILTVNLLKEWLTKYKFCDWEKTETRNLPVDANYKKKRAEDIANALGNNSKWNVHSRPIMIDDLKELNIKIDDYTNNDDLKKVIRQYIDFMNQYIIFKLKNPNPNVRFIHTRLFM